MLENAKLGLYIKEHKESFDKIMVDLFTHFNALGEKDVSGKLQLVYLDTMLHLFITKAGLPKDKQIGLAKGLLESVEKSKE